MAVSSEVVMASSAADDSCGIWAVVNATAAAVVKPTIWVEPSAAIATLPSAWTSAVLRAAVCVELSTPICVEVSAAIWAVENAAIVAVGKPAMVAVGRPAIWAVVNAVIEAMIVSGTNTTVMEAIFSARLKSAGRALTNDEQATPFVVLSLNLILTGLCNDFAQAPQGLGLCRTQSDY
jgi:hypothetical protein